jgi:hypothetical protein
MRDPVRMLIPCLLALACVGATYPDRQPLPRGSGEAQGTRVSVTVCVLPAEPRNCGPRVKVSSGGLKETWPPHAKHAGVVTAPRPKIKCPPSCVAQPSGGATVDLKAEAKVDPSYGTYEFDHWKGRCTGRSKQCRMRVSKNENARVVAVFRSRQGP